MNHYVNTLLLVLLIQCVLAAVLFWPGETRTQTVQREPMVSFAMDAVQELRVGDEYDNEAVLLRSGDRWVLPELDKLPADGERVSALLSALAAAGEGWPVAESSAARQRFQVADYYYQRRLELRGEGTELGVFYLGTAPGFRKVHARNEVHSAIYSIDYNTFDAPATSGGWLDPRLLQVRTPVAIAGDAYSLRLDNGTWRSGTGDTVDRREVDALANALRALQVEGVADEDIQRELASAEAEVELAVSSLAGEVTLELFSLQGEHYIHSSEYPFFFLLSAYDYDRLVGIDTRLLTGADNGA